MKKIIILLIISFFLLLPVFSAITALNITNSTENKENSKYSEEDDADTPIWVIGNSWIYDITINGGLSSYWNINNLKMNDLSFTVEEILTDMYRVSVSGDITGGISLDLDLIKISGQFVDTEIEGNMFIDKSTLAINELQATTITGYIKPNLLPKIPFTADCSGFFEYGIPLLNFPINNEDTWFVDTITITFSMDVSLLPNPIEQTIYVGGHYVECHEWDIVDVQAGEYDALKLSSVLGYEHNVWYSVAAGNIVKMVGKNIPFSWGDLGTYNIDIELVSTTYVIESDPPTTPSTLSGPTEVIAGFTESYTAGGATDPDGDMIRYIFNWGDGKKTGSDFLESGEDATVEYYWTEKGTYHVKVKARDKYGSESAWSDPITVTVSNDAPLKPDPPEGPLVGYWKKTHTYTSNTTDPDGHRIRFLFNWGDGSNSYSQYVESGETGSASHRWSWPRSYTIKVKAIDEFGEESLWSDPITVTMPRTRINTFIQNFFDNHPVIDKIVKNIFGR